MVVALVILSITGGFTYLLNSNDGQTDSSQEQTTAPTEEMPTTSRGTYVDYSGSVIAETSGTKLIFFHAPWCPQCRALEADIKSRGVPEGVTIIKADYDTSQELRRKYGVTIQTTIVKIDDNGNLLAKYVAYDDPSVESIKQNLL